MPPNLPPTGGLVLYKNRPARVKDTGDKLAIALPDGKLAQVRPKDVTLLHPGPTGSLELQPPTPLDEIETVWELLEGQPTDLEELSQLLYGDFTPAAAWAAWRQVEEGLHFSGTADGPLQPRPAAEIEADRQQRQKRQAETEAHQGLLERLRQGTLAEGDRRHLAEMVALAFEERDSCRLLRELGLEQTPAIAHRTLLRLGVWDQRTNPYPRRFALATEAPTVELQPWEEQAEERLDLTSLEAFAIDDEGSNDPDDAVSLDGDTLWVHVADAAVAVPPDSPADIEARGRGATLYLPEGKATMLPTAATGLLGLGLQPQSPALSFGLRFDGEAALTDIRIVPSRVRVTRLSYAEAEGMLHQTHLAGLHALAQRLKARRAAADAVFIDYPEVKIRLEAEGRIAIRPLPPHQSREMVLEAMLAAGEAAALFARRHDIPLPFARQPPPEAIENIPEGLAGMLAKRRSMRPAEHSLYPEAHAGLGLPHYAQATSPLRRYLDLVVHQQLRAFVCGQPTLSTDQVAERLGATQAVAGSVRRAERQANRHWTLVYLSENPGWRGRAVVVEVRPRRAWVVLPEIGLETSIPLDGAMQLNQELELELVAVDLPELEARFRRC